MNLDTYQTLSFRTAKVFDSIEANLVHAALGIATEGGEFTTEVKRAAIYGKAIGEAESRHMVEES